MKTICLNEIVINYMGLNKNNKAREVKKVMIKAKTTNRQVLDDGAIKASCEKTLFGSAASHYVSIKSGGSVHSTCI